MSAERAKLNLRLPADLHAQAAHLAEAQGISLNAFLTLGVRNWVTAQKRSMGPLPPSAPPPPAARSSAEAPPQQVAREKVGRNEPCPCGSGRKWKRCHGKTT